MAITLEGCRHVAGTFQVPSTIQKPLVFEAWARGVCLLLLLLTLAEPPNCKANLNLSALPIVVQIWLHPELFGMEET